MKLTFSSVMIICSNFYQHIKMKLNFQSRKLKLNRCAALSIIGSGKAMQNVASRCIEIACGDEIKMVERQRIITDF